MKTDIDITPLLAPLRLNGLELHNRFVVPSMQRGVSSDGRPTRELAEYYRQRGEGGFALVMSESCAIDHPSSGGGSKVLTMSPEGMDAWRMCVENVRETGSHMLLQLFHRGALYEDFQDVPGALEQTISPSGLITATKTGGRAMTQAEMAEIRDCFVETALMAKAIGAEGVELHGAHGYLLDQFLWRQTNRRDDGYGGDDMRDRVRFPAEVVAAIRKAAGPDFVISFRFSQWKGSDYVTGQVAENPEELGVMLAALRTAGVDLFHVSTRMFHMPAWPESDLTLAGWTKRLTDVPVLTVGGIGGNTDLQSAYMNALARNGAPERPFQEIVADSLREVVRRFNAGEFDLVAVGRASIGDPQWANKVAAGDLDAIRQFSVDDLLTLLSQLSSKTKAPNQSKID